VLVREPTPAYALRKYVHDVPTKNGSSLIASMTCKTMSLGRFMIKAETIPTQKPMGILTQFSPAAAMLAKSCSVWNAEEL
jgi:hypothetical protein